MCGFHHSRAACSGFTWNSGRRESSEKGQEPSFQRLLPVKHELEWFQLGNKTAFLNENPTKEGTNLKQSL